MHGSLMLVLSTLFLSHHILRAAAFVSLLLIGALIFTGLASSFYKRERQLLGEAHYRRGQSLVSGGQTGEAVEEYRKALLFSPDKSAYRLSLVTALLEAGRLDEAQAHAEQLLQDDPTNGKLNMILARVAARRHQTQRAIDDYQRAVYEYWPTAEAGQRREARWELVGLLGEVGRRNEAVGELMQLYANAPPDPKIRAKVGFLLLSYGATSEALRVFRDLARDSPQDATAHKGLAEAYFAAGDYLSARHVYQRAARLAPKDAALANELALSNAVIDLDPALPDITSAERFRRSGNLLRRVLADLGACPVSEDLQGRLDDAGQLLKLRQSAGSDVSLQLQNASQQLWNDRALFCPQTAVSDRAVEAALGTIQS